MSISTIPYTGTSKTVLSTASVPGVPTQVNEINIAAAFEIQSTDGAFIPPRMTGAQMNALTPVVPGMQVFVTDAATVPSGMYIRGAATWNIVANSGDQDNVTVDQDDSKPDAAVAVWKTDGLPELESTEILINAGNIINGVYTITTNSTSGADLPDGAPIYGMNILRNPPTEGIGTSAEGTMTLWSGGQIQAEIAGSGDGTNRLKMGGADAGDPVVIGAIGADADISIAVSPKGAGQLFGNNGTAALPSYSFGNSNEDGMYSAAVGTLGFSAGGSRQLAVKNIGVNDGSNYLEISAADSAGTPVINALGADATVHLELNTKGTSYVKISSDTAVNALLLQSSETGVPVSIAANGSDTHIDLQIVPQGNGQILSNVGSASNPIYSFTSNPADGIYSVAAGAIGFSAGGFSQAVIGDSGDGTNQIDIGGSSAGIPVLIGASGTDANIPIKLVSKGDSYVQASSSDHENSLLLAGSNTGSAVSVSASGSDTNIDLSVLPKGTGGILSNDGTASKPIYSFTSDQDCGMYRVSSGIVGFSANGAKQVFINNSGSNDGTNYLELIGSSAAGTVSLSAKGGDTDIPLRLSPKGTGAVNAGSSTNYLSLVSTSTISQISGVGTATDVDVLLSPQGAGSVKTGSSTNYLGFVSTSSSSQISAIGTATDVDFLLTPKGAGSVKAGSSTNYLGFVSTSTTAQISTIGTGSNISLSLITKGTGNVLINSGTQSLPGLAFIGDPDTGIYRFGANAMGFCIGGNGLLFMQSSQVLATDGSAVSPVYSFLNNTGIGIYSAPGGMIGIATAAPQASSTAITISIPVAVNGTTYYLKASVAA